MLYEVIHDFEDIFVRQNDEIEKLAKQYVDSRAREGFLEQENKRLLEEVQALSLGAMDLRQEIKDRKDHASGYEIYVDQRRREIARLKELLRRASGALKARAALLKIPMPDVIANEIDSELEGSNG